MPFKSEKQRRYLWANKPDIAREFQEKEDIINSLKKLKRKKTRKKKK